jgi:hypothetical protein
MSNNHSDRNDEGSHPQQSTGGEQEHGHSGEGAASALAHLKSQARQQRREGGQGDDSGGSPA